eukprot:5667024-Pleurochrysis_carterae.AAC.1
MRARPRLVRTRTHTHARTRTQLNTSAPQRGRQSLNLELGNMNMGNAGERSRRAAVSRAIVCSCEGGKAKKASRTEGLEGGGDHEP